MKKITTILFCLITATIFAQDSQKKEEPQDTISLDIDEVIVIAKSRLNNYGQEKPLSSIDEYLDQSNQVSMIKRGNYAWEPTLNNMVTDRLNITIDGMQIYGACTDKMDPVTSYVDVSNLDQVNINSGQEGTENANCLGGAIDMKMPTSKFNNSGWKSSIDLGYETNGNYSASGLELEYSGKKFFASGDGIFRKSGNYQAGGREEINYSQFEKMNMSFKAGYKIAKHQKIESLFLYDKATDVGYTALPMDVSLAKATIASLTHFYMNPSKKLYSWETKAYFNTITHIMDDSKRPLVPIRMDMPGWSDTYGFYSKVKVNLKKHHLLFNFNGNHNRAIAEMTMYPNDPTENSMFMYTWPDVKTQYLGLYFKDKVVFKNNRSLSISTRMGTHNNRIDNHIGLQSLRIYYPEMDARQTRFLSSFSVKYAWDYKKYNFSLGTGYGERAPSVSEGYGFYLFNSFDNYDYIGNPTLENEKSVESSAKITYKNNKMEVETLGAFFYIKDYIIGEINPELAAMTIGASGVRIYKSLESASIFSSSIALKYHLNEEFDLKTSLGYNYGKGSNGENLPLIRPFSYFTELNYLHNRLNAGIRVIGDGNQTHYSADYGEDATPGYAVINAHLGYKWFVKNNNTLIAKVGVDNLLDRSYSTYADWNNILRPGRNFFVNISYLMR